MSTTLNHSLTSKHFIMKIRQTLFKHFPSIMQHSWTHMVGRWMWDRERERKKESLCYNRHTLLTVCKAHRTRQCCCRPSAVTNMIMTDDVCDWFVSHWWQWPCLWLWSYLEASLSDWLDVYLASWAFLALCFSLAWWENTQTCSGQSPHRQ